MECQAIKTDKSKCSYKARNKFNNVCYCYLHYKKFSSMQECSICMTDITSKKQSVTTLCDHVFHKSCLRKWENSKLNTHKTCPLCRTNIFKDKIYEKLKQNPIDLLKFHQWAFIMMTHQAFLTFEELEIELHNKKKYSKMCANSPGCSDIFGEWNHRPDIDFFLEKDRINFELSELLTAETGVIKVPIITHIST